MSKTVEFFFDFGSPTSYLAWTQLPAIAAQAGSAIVWRPMLLGGVFKATGNASPVTVPAKGRWMFGDIARWAKRYGVPLAFNPHFPINTLTLAQMSILASIAIDRWIVLGSTREQWQKENATETTAPVGFV